jgi:hypothetical protein
MSEPARLKEWHCKYGYTESDHWRDGYYSCPARSSVVTRTAPASGQAEISDRSDLRMALEVSDAWDRNDTGTYADLAKLFAAAFAEVRRDALAPVLAVADELDEHPAIALSAWAVAERIREAAGGAE